MSLSSSQKALPEELQVTALPTTALEAKLRTLREQSQKHSQALTQKLATSQSGQNLLHIGTSLSTLPPDLHSLLTQLHPLLGETEESEKECFELLQKLVACANEIRILQRRVDNAQECAQLYEDLEASERDVERDVRYRRSPNDVDFDEDDILGMFLYSYWYQQQSRLSVCSYVSSFFLLHHAFIRRSRSCVVAGTGCPHHTVFSARLAVEYSTVIVHHNVCSRCARCSSVLADSVGKGH